MCPEVPASATLGPAHRSGVRKAGTAGVPVVDTEVVVVDADRRPVDPGERGEVCVRGPRVMVGHHNRQDATDEVLVDGWPRPGDLDVAGQDGLLSIVDSRKDVPLSEGYHGCPRELEEMLAVGEPDAAVGELPVAFVVPTSPAALTADVNERVVACRRLRDVIFVDQSPVSAAGKVLERELRGRLS